MGRGLGQRSSCALLHVSRSMMTYKRRQPEKDAPIRAIIDDVVSKHPAWGKRLVHDWMIWKGHPYTLGRVQRVYRLAGHAAQWRRRTRKIRTRKRVEPIAIQTHDVWCMDFAEDCLMNSRKVRAFLIKDEATSYGLCIQASRSFKGVDVKSILDEQVRRYGKPKHIRCDNGSQRPHSRSSERLGAGSEDHNSLHRSRKTMAERLC